MNGSLGNLYQLILSVIVDRDNKQHFIYLLLSLAATQLVCAFTIFALTLNYPGN